MSAPSPDETPSADAATLPDAATMSGPPTRHPWGRSALALLALAGIVAATGVYFSTRPSQRSNGQVTTPGRSTALNLRVGDCVSLQPRTRATAKRVTTVPCGTPHNGQVYSLQYAPTGPYPGPPQLYSNAMAQCEAAATTFLGRPRGGLHVHVVLAGDASNWDETADHIEACILYDPARSFTGDIRSLA